MFLPQRSLHFFEANDSRVGQRRSWPSVARMIQTQTVGHLAALPTVFLTRTIPKLSGVFHRLIPRFRT